MYRELRTFRLAVFLDGLARAVAPGIYAAGALVLAAKIAGRWGGIPAPSLAAFAAVLAIATITLAWLLARRVPRSPEDVRAWLDLKNRAGGAVLANENPDRWPALSVRPVLSPVPVLKALPWPLLFLAAVLLVPQRDAAAAPSGRGVRRKIAAVERAIDAAEQHRALPSRAIDEFRERLHAVEDAAARRPEGAAEAADALRQQLEDAMWARVAAGLQSLEKAARAREAVASPAASPAAARAAMNELAAALQALARAEGGAGELPEDIARALAKMAPGVDMADLASWAENLDLSGLNPADLQKLTQALRRAAREGADCVGSCVLGDGARASLAALLAGMPSLSDRELNLAGLAEAVEGDGSVGRGRADAPLAFGNESDAAGARFAAKPLPPGQSLLPGVRLGMERRALPEENRPPEEFRAVVRGGQTVDGAVYGGESGASLGPARAEAAAAYFNRLSRP